MKILHRSTRRIGTLFYKEERRPKVFGKFSQTKQISNNHVFLIINLTSYHVISGPSEKEQLLDRDVHKMIEEQHELLSEIHQMHE